MNLFLLRHGIAAERDPVRFPNDSLRPLSARGHEQVGAIAEAMWHLDLGIDSIWTSPLLRTCQTAAPVAQRLALNDRMQQCEQLTPDGDLVKLLGEIGRLDPLHDNLLLVGHEPYLSELLSVLTSGKSTMQAKLKKGSLTKLQVSGPIRFGKCATLLWLLPPTLLAHVGEARVTPRTDRPFSAP